MKPSIQSKFDVKETHAPEYDLTALLEAGVHFGHAASKWNPKMDEWLYDERGGVHIFDLAKTAAQLQAAYDVLYHLGKSGKTVLIVATKRQAKDIVSKAAEEAGMFYITSRWLGGFVTNWNQVKRSIQRMNELSEGLETGKYEAFTKYERVQLEKELNKLSRFFSGVASLKKTPDCILIIDSERESIALKEAGVADIPVIAVVDSNADPDPIDLVIPANDDAVKSLELIVGELTTAFSAGVKAGGGKKAAPTSEKTTQEEAQS